MVYPVKSLKAINNFHLECLKSSVTAFTLLYTWNPGHGNEKFVNKDTAR